jgi:hypothetical protein
VAKKNHKTQSSKSTVSLNTRLAETLQWIVARAVEGFGPFSSAEMLADEHLQKHDSPEEAIEGLIRSEVAKAAASGFVMGLPGFLAMPFTIPANIGSDYLLAARVVAAIAKLRGWNLNSPKVQTSIVLCLVGHQGKEIVKSVSKTAGVKAAQTIIGATAAKTALHLEHKVGSKLLARVVENGAAGLAKAIPFAGGLLGAGLDASYLIITARTAKELFPRK